MTKLIIFDWDDVFTLGSKEGYFACYHEALEDVGVYLSPEEEEKRIKAKWGQPHTEELRELLKDNLSDNPSLLDKAAKKYEEHYFGDTYIDELKLVRGSNDLLVRLADKYLLAIATGCHKQVLTEKVFPKFNIPNVFIQIVSAYDISDPKKTKPDPYMIEQILEKQHILPQNAIMVGDAINDMKMGMNAGVKPVAVLTGHMNRHDAEEIGVKEIISDVTHLEEVLT